MSDVVDLAEWREKKEREDFSFVATCGECGGQHLVIHMDGSLECPVCDRLLHAKVSLEFE